MSTRPFIPERYNKRRNDFSGGPATEGVAQEPGAGRIIVQDEGIHVPTSSTWDFQGDLVQALANPSTGATDVLMSLAIPTRPTRSIPPVHGVILTASGAVDYIGIRWTDSPNAELFTLFRSEVQGGPYDAIYEDLALGYDDYDVAVGIIYYYIVVPSNRFGPGPASNEDSAMLGGVAGTLNGLRWELPNTGAGTLPENCSCPASAVLTAVMGGTPGTTYSVGSQFRGVVEQKSYPGGVPAADPYNIYSIGVSDPPSLTYLNAGTSGQLVVYAIDFTMAILVDAGATVTLTADSIEGVEIRNNGTGPGLVVPGVPPDPLAYDGQFIQMDIVSIDDNPPGFDISQIVYPPIETRLQHSSLDRLRWKLAGHTAPGKRLAGFDGDGSAAEVPLTVSGAPHSAVETDGTGRVSYGVMPGPTLEYQVVAAELLGMEGLV